MPTATVGIVVTEDAIDTLFTLETKKATWFLATCVEGRMTPMVAVGIAFSMATATIYLDAYGLFLAVDIKSYADGGRQHCYGHRHPPAFP
jgi:hypothetical protein